MDSTAAAGDGSGTQSVKRPIYRPYVSRWQRIVRFWSTRPRYWIREYPTHVFSYVFFGIPGIMFAVYHMWRDGGIMQPKEYGRPYFRDHYVVYRPTDPIVLRARPPEDYPPRWLSNRPTGRNRNHRIYEDFGWDLDWNAIDAKQNPRAE